MWWVLILKKIRIMPFFLGGGGVWGGGKGRGVFSITKYI